MREPCWHQFVADIVFNIYTNIYLYVYEYIFCNASGDICTVLLKLHVMMCCRNYMFFRSTLMCCQNYMCFWSTLMCCQNYMWFWNLDMLPKLHDLSFGPPFWQKIQTPCYMHCLKHLDIFGHKNTTFCQFWWKYPLEPNFPPLWVRFVDVSSLKTK